MISRQALRVFLLLIAACFFTLVTSQQTRNCAKSPPQKAPTAIDTSSKLNRLRRDMADFNLLAAYLITPKDAHQSEYTAAHEMRLQYISGFDGYEGLGVVTTDKALLWTLDKYRERAEELVDCNWEIFTPGSENYIEPENWLYENMETSSRIGADMTYLTFAEHERFVNAFQGELIISKIPGLIDDLWNSDGNRPPRPTGTLMSVSTQYTGASWLSKVNTIRDKMSEKNVGAMVLTDLVDISWVFNLRGADTPYNPLFFAYAIIKQDTVNLYVDGGRIDGTGIPVCTGSEDKSSCVTTNFYTGFMSDLAQLAAVGYGDLWMEESASYAVIDSVKDFNAGFITEISPIKQIRSRKNVREQESIQNVQIRDSVAVCAFMQWLENEMKSGNNPTELSAMGKLKYFREKSENYRGDSIPPISAYGSHAATIDHTPTIYNDMTINTTGLYLFDSGAQYIDGATDMSRTLHFGTPSKNETDAYTTVLRALIRLAVTVFPKGMYGGELDFLTRTPLWKAGMTYPHATGHGLGAFVAHEDPIRLEKRNGISSVDEIPIQTNMYISNEPGYYKENEFGVRLEVIMKVIEADDLATTPTEQLMAFQVESLVPFETALIDVNQMVPEEVEWYNAYHQRVYEVVGEELLKSDLGEVHAWLKEKTMPVIETEGPALAVAGAGRLVLENSHIFALSLLLATSLIL